MCDCYRIDGPFISEDPDCPLHGRERLLDRVEELEHQVRRLTQQLELADVRAHGPLRSPG